MSIFLRRIIQILIRAYQLIISPFLGSNCRFFPSCSEYASQAVEQLGIFQGGYKTFLRLLRCHPFHHGGSDPVCKPHATGSVAKLEKCHSPLQGNPAFLLMGPTKSSAYINEL